MASTERRPPARSVSRLLWQTSWSAEPATTTTAMGGPRTSTSSAAPARAPPAPAYADPDTPRGGEERQRRSSTTSNGGGGFGGAPPLSRSSSQRRLSVPNLSSADARTDAWVGAAVATAGGTEVDLTARASQLRAEAALLEAAAVVVAGPTGAGRGHVTDGESVAKAASKLPRRSSTSKPREPPPRQAACLPAGATPPWECLAQAWTELTTTLCSGWPNPPRGTAPAKSNSTGSTAIANPLSVAVQRGQKPVRSNTRRIDLPPFGPSAGGDSTPTTPGSGSDADGNLLAPNAASGAAPERSLTRVLSDSSLNGGGERTRRESLTGGSSRRNLHPLAPSLSQTRLGLSVRTSAEENRGRDNQPGSAKSGDGDTPKAIASHMMWQPNGVRSTHFKVKYVPSISK